MPHIDAIEVIVTGIFDQASTLISSFFFFIPLMPSIATGTTLCLPPLLFSSSPHLYQASLFTSPASPIALKRPLSSSHGDKVACKFVVCGRCVTNAKPTQVNQGSINNVYTAPFKSVPS